MFQHAASFNAQVRTWKFAVSRHAGRATSREKIFPSTIKQEGTDG